MFWLIFVPWCIVLSVFFDKIVLKKMDNSGKRLLYSTILGLVTSFIVSMIIGLIVYQIYFGKH